MTFTKPEINYLLWLIQRNQEQGFYYGNKAQFDKRVNRIVKKLVKIYEHE